MPAKDKVAITVRLDSKVARRLKNVASAADRSVSWLVARIIEEEIAIKESHIRAIREGMDSARSGRLMDAEDFFAERDEKVSKRREGQTNRRRSA